jgi:hypothetical protein
MNSKQAQDVLYVAFVFWKIERMTSSPLIKRKKKYTKVHALMLVQVPVPDYFLKFQTH